MITQPLTAWEVEDQDVVVIDDEPVTVVGIVDEGATFLFLFLDKYGDTFEKVFAADYQFDWVIKDDE